MLKNVSGQKIGCQMVSATDGSAFTGSVTVAVTVDAGTQATGSVGSGACTHEGNGYHTYAPAQAETNGDLLAFTFTGTGAVPATIQVYSLPTTGVLAPATLGRTLVVDAAGLADANMVKLGPTGSGTAQTAKDVGAINVTNLNTLSGHDPGATLGTSTLTQAQVTGGAYALNNASFGFNAALDFTTTQKAATLARVTLVDTTTTNTDMIAAAGIRTAVGLASANLDTQLGLIYGVIDTEVATANTNISALITTVGVAGAGLSAIPKTGFKLASDGADSVLVDGKTLPAALQIIAAAAIGKVSGAGTGTEVFVGLDGTTTRATVTVDSSGNRSGVVYV